MGALISTGLVILFVLACYLVARVTHKLIYNVSRGSTPEQAGRGYVAGGIVLAVWLAACTVAGVWRGTEGFWLTFVVAIPFMLAVLWGCVENFGVPEDDSWDS